MTKVNRPPPPTTYPPLSHGVKCMDSISFHSQQKIKQEKKNTRESGFITNTRRQYITTYRKINSFRYLLYTESGVTQRQTSGEILLTVIISPH